MEAFKVKMIIVAIVLALAGFALGFYFGADTAINMCIAKASKFINVNETLIRDYLYRAGITN